MPTVIEKDACELLDADHIAVKHLFVEYARLANTGDLSGQKAAIARKVCRELTIHAQIEEEIFYPALRKAIGEAKLLDEAESGHQEAKRLIGEILAMKKADTSMDVTMSELARVIDHHVKEERDELFPKAKSAREVDLETLGARLRERQQELGAALAPAP